MKYMLGVDVGTTAVKAALVSEKGDILVSHPYEYKLLIPKENFVELDPEEYWKAFKEVTREILETSKVSKNDVAVVSVSSQGETFVPIDRNGKPLCRAIVWLDNRSGEEANQIKNEFEVSQVYQITGQPEIVPTWPATKILWLKRNEPAVFSKTQKYLLVEDYLIYKLSGEFATDYSLLTSTLLFDIRTRNWWKEMLDFIGIRSDQLSKPMPSGSLVGEITEQAAKETGLSPETVVVTGALDHAAGAVGTGNIVPGIVTEYTGSVLAIYATIEEPLYYPEGKVPCHCHAIGDMYFLLLWCQTAGTVLKWFRDEFCQLEKKVSKHFTISPYKLMDLLAEKVSPTSEGLIVLPHLLGAASPEFNPKAKGVFFGITPRHTKAHFIRALMESVAYMMRKNLEIMVKMNIRVKEIRSIGGGANSRLWGQVKSDVSKIPIKTMQIQEASSLGVAILGGIAAGIFQDVHTGINLLVKFKDRIDPISSNQKIYDEGYKKYIQLYSSLEELFN
jgi:xylulokinase